MTVKDACFEFLLENTIRSAKAVSGGRTFRDV